MLSPPTIKDMDVAMAEAISNSIRLLEENGYAVINAQCIGSASTSFALSKDMVEDLGQDTEQFRSFKGYRVKEAVRTVAHLLFDQGFFSVVEEYDERHQAYVTRVSLRAIEP